MFTFAPILPQMYCFLSQIRLLTLRILSQFEAELPPQTEVRLSVQVLSKFHQSYSDNELMY